MSGFIPPPFPFVEAWPRVFADASQSRWLTPSTAPAFAAGGGGTGLQWTAPRGEAPGVPGYVVQQPLEQHVEAGDADDEDDDSEYEYGFVLTDEWRERLVRPGNRAGGDEQRHQGQSRSLPRGASKPRQQQQRNRRAAETARPPGSRANSSRADHLQREFEAAKTRELAARWRLERTDIAPPSGRTVRSLETALTARFDEFCDACQPVVWPHASAR